VLVIGASFQMRVLCTHYNVRLWCTQYLTKQCGYHGRMATNKPQDGYQKQGVRIPRELHAHIHEAAATSGRSYNSELISRLEQSFIGAADAQVAVLAADLAKAKRDAAYAAYISERWLMSVVILWDAYLEIRDAVDAMGLQELIPEDTRAITELLGEDADDEYKRHSEDFDPMALHDYLEATEQEYQTALAGVVRLVANAQTPAKDDAQAAKALRTRILNRKRREYLPVDTAEDAGLANPIPETAPPAKAKSKASAKHPSPKPTK